MTTRRLPMLMVVAALVFAACGSDDDDAGSPAGVNSDSSVPTVPVDDPSDAQDGDPLAGEWLVADLTLDGVQIVLSDEQPVTMTVADGEVSGTAACNGYGGTLASTFEAGGGSFAVSDLFWTEMACEQDVMVVEQAFLAALQQVDSYELADDVYVAAAGVGTGFRLTRP